MRNTGLYHNIKLTIIDVDEGTLMGNDILQNYVLQLLIYVYPTDIERYNNVIVRPKQRCDVIWRNGAVFITSCARWLVSDEICQLKKNNADLLSIIPVRRCFDEN